jgi:hypothetical protein
VFNKECDMTVKGCAPPKRRRFQAPGSLGAPGIFPALRSRRTPTLSVALGMTGALVAGLLGLGTVTAAPAHAASSPTTPMWSTQLDFDNNGTAWSESYFAGLRADGLTTAEPRSACRRAPPDWKWPGWHGALWSPALAGLRWSRAAPRLPRQR